MMTIKEAVSYIRENNLEEELANLVLSEIETDEEPLNKVGNSICNALECGEAANEMLLAITGWSFTTLVTGLKLLLGNDVEEGEDDDE